MASRSRLPPAPLHRIADVLQRGYFPPQRSDYHLPPTVNRLTPDQAQALRGLGNTSPQEEGCCPICQEEWTKILAPKVNLGCSHSLCSACFQQASEHGLRSCPLCRRDLRHLIAPNNDLRRVDDLQETAAVMVGMRTSVDEQRRILMMIQRRQLQRLVIPPEVGEDDEYTASPVDPLLPQVVRFIYHIRTPVE